jgi:uncharacterized protein with PIN domain
MVNVYADRVRCFSLRALAPAWFNHDSSSYGPARIVAAFLLDGMLRGLARRLRLMGYDCALPPEGVPGERLPAKARAEGRTLVTGSRKIQQLAPGEIMFIPPGELNDQVRAITSRWPIDTARHGLTRCSRDNTPLEAVSFDEVADRLPPLVAERRPDPVHRCPACGRLYWEGTHTRRLRDWFEHY